MSRVQRRFHGYLENVWKLVYDRHLYKLIQEYGFLFDNRKNSGDPFLNLHSFKEKFLQLKMNESRLDDDFSKEKKRENTRGPKELPLLSSSPQITGKMKTMRTITILVIIKK